MMAREKGKLKWVMIGVVFALIALATWLTTWRRTKNQKEQPNGFPLLVEAAKQIVGVNPILQTKPPTKEQLQKYVAANQVPLQTLRKALSMPCTIPSEVAEESVFNPFAGPLSLSHWRELGRLLVAEGKWHELEERFDQAAQSYLDAAKLGLKVKGGAIIHKLTGEAIAMIGQKPLLLVAHKLSDATSQQIARELMQLLDEEEPLDVVLARDRKMFRRKMLKHSLIGAFLPLPKEIEHEITSSVVPHFTLRRTAFGLTAIELALHAFEQKEHRLPQTLNKLVPQYLPKLPADEISKKPFVYRIVDGKAKVYSVGRNGKDEGGKGDDVTARLWERLKDANFRKTYFNQP